MTSNDADAKLRADIEKFGWVCLNVWPDKDDDRQTAFSYTIGLVASHGHPEIMVFGLGDKAHGILAECANLIKQGVRFVAGQTSCDVLAGDCRVAFKAVRKDCFDEYVGTAVRCHGTREFDALVLFWPDKSGQFPWETPAPGAQAEALNIV